MLLGDGRAAVRPSLAEVDKIGDDHLGDHGRDAHVGEQTIKHGVRADIIEPRQRLGETRAPILDPVPCRPGIGVRSRGHLSGRCGEHRFGRLPSRHPGCQQLLHRSHPALVLRSVQAKASGAAQRLQQPVAAFPCSQQGGRLADAVAELADANTRSQAQEGASSSTTEYTHILQTLDKTGVTLYSPLRSESSVCPKYVQGGSR